MIYDKNQRKAFYKLISRDLSIWEGRGQNPSNDQIKRTCDSITKYGYYVIWWWESHDGMKDPVHEYFHDFIIFRSQVIEKSSEIQKTLEGFCPLL